MSDQTRPGNQPEPEAERDTHIRALLAELGSGPTGQTMPPEVAARLEDTLARLVAERSPEDAGETDQPVVDTVVPLRRRWLARTAAAAAAVIVVGLGGITAANLGVFGGGSSSDTASSSDAGGSTADQPEAQSRPESALEPTPAQPRKLAAGGDAAEDRALEAATLPAVSSAAFSTDVTNLLRRSAVAATPELRQRGSTGQAPVDGLTTTACPGPVITDGAVPTPVRYDGRPAVLVVHPEQDGTRLVEAWSCAGDLRLRTATLGR